MIKFIFSPLNPFFNQNYLGRCNTKVTCQSGKDEFLDGPSKRSGSSISYSSNFLNRIELLCPPNPKEFDKAMSTL